MSDFGLSPHPCGNPCFLPERKYLRIVSLAIREALNADAGVGSDKEFWCVTDPIEYDDDLEGATKHAMLSQLSGAEAEVLARALRSLGAPSATETVRELRVSYAACVRDLHAAGRTGVEEDLLCELAMQLVDPIRSLALPCASFATEKILVELLAQADVEVDAWLGALWIRVLHPGSRVGSATALRSLIADFRAKSKARRRSKRKVRLESLADLRERLRKARGRDEAGSPSMPPKPGSSDR